jgi:hypothetical protein
LIQTRLHVLPKTVEQKDVPEEIRERKKRNETPLLNQVAKRRKALCRLDPAVEPWPLDLEKPLRGLCPKKDPVGEVRFGLLQGAESCLEIFKARRASRDLSHGFGAVADKPWRMDKDSTGCLHDWFKT